MVWFRLEDDFPAHPKVVRAGTEAAWLFVAGGCYCSHYLTDGLIPKEALSSISAGKQGPRLAGVLVAVELWHDRGDFYEVHDYLVYNPTREKVLDGRRKAAERREKGGRTSAERRANVARTSDDDQAMFAEPFSSPDPYPIEESKDSSRAQPRNPIWDALVEIFGDASTASRQSMYGKAVRELKQIGAEPDDVLRRGNLMLQKDWKDPTPAALLKHWDTLGASNGKARNPYDHDEFDGT